MNTKVADLEKEAYRLAFLASQEKTNIQREQEISSRAGKLVGRIYKKLLAAYQGDINDETLSSLNQLCVQLVFCYFAEDDFLFGNSKTAFHDYMAAFPAAQLRKALMSLFEILDTPVADRAPDEDPILLAFPYVNGGLFSNKKIRIPQITDEIRNLLLEASSFEWAQISPTIFGAMFESTLNPVTQHDGGMHYTSIENIHKVIDPLFMNDLQAEFDAIAKLANIKQRTERLRAFQERLAKLTFLDPACGSGNFLTETYLSLRRLENACLRLIYDTDAKGIQIGFADDNIIKVRIQQFYGIEINDFAVTVAKTALWIAESQMIEETESIVNQHIEFLPLTNYANIVEGNALRMEWRYLGYEQNNRQTVFAEKTHLYTLSNEPFVASEPIIQYGEIDLYTKEVIVEKETKKEPESVEYSYIIGNPPFVGARLMSEEQKEDVAMVFGKGWKNIGNLDYVSCWYKKASEIMYETDTRAALVSTNSICQGETVANLWKPLIDNGMHIDFAYRTFRWDSESYSKAHVHCVIVGFSYGDRTNKPIIFDGDTQIIAQNINGYLIDADNVWIESRNRPICNVPEIGIGNKPIDDGNYLFSKEEMEAFIKLEPHAKQYFKPWYGSQEFINQNPRYCLWLGDCSPTELRKMPHCLKRIENVHNFRLASKSAGTRRLAELPTRFHVENMPKETYIVIPETSSENRKYIPIGFLTPDVFCSNALRLIPNATLYHFGVLTSSVHMAWTRVVCGRLKSDYRYSKDIVYNNFPWCEPTEKQKAKIEETAQGILDARALYPEASLADLYDELTMPIELRRAHQANDKAVMAAYGFSLKMSESEIVAALMKHYEEI